MQKSDYIEFEKPKLKIPILFENRTIIILDKPPFWLLAPSHWQHTSRNLQAALENSIIKGDYWARSRNLKYIRFIHRLDADTSGLLIFSKNPGAIQSYNKLFVNNLIHKTYAVVVKPPPDWNELLCYMPLSQSKSKMLIDPLNGKPAETRFKLLKIKNNKALLQAKPITGRTHQIRVHLAALGNPVIDDIIYGVNKNVQAEKYPLALRSARLIFKDPFEKNLVDVKASLEDFLFNYGFETSDWKWTSDYP
ncbi:MAG TPA: RNA pseudouridine synthase [Verrucomicrobiota bacterium]|nr:RNA pseudouridine synthase [Verrucomicrobiota bacterium]